MKFRGISSFIDARKIYAVFFMVMCLSSHSYGQIYITDEGDVAVGTSTPLTRLHVKGNSNPSKLYVEGAGGAVQITAHRTDSDNWLSLLAGGSNNHLLIKNNATFNITHSVSGDGPIDASYTNLIERMTVTPDGDVGIGTTSPSGKLHVQHELFADAPVISSTLANSSSGIKIRNDDGSHEFAILTGNSGNTYKGGLTFYYVGTNERQMVIKSTGDVGIGTVSPTEKLDVDGYVRARSHDEDNSLTKLAAFDANGVLHYIQRDDVYSGSAHVGKGVQLKTDVNIQTWSNNNWMIMGDWSGVPNFNDDTGIFTILNDVITVNHTGRIRIEAGVYFGGSGSSRQQMEMRVFKGSNSEGYIADCYIRNTEGMTTGAITYVYTMDVSSGDQISLRARRGDTNSASNVKTLGDKNTWTITIVK